MATKTSTPPPTGRAAINCGDELKHQAKAFTASLDFLKVASAKFGLSTTKIDSLNSDGTVLTEMLSQFCQLYKVTDETTYPTSEYRRDISAIGDWQVKIAAFAQDVHAGAAGDKKPDTADKEKKQGTLDKLLDAGKSLISKGKKKTANTPPTPVKGVKSKTAPTPVTT